MDILDRHEQQQPAKLLFVTTCTILYLCSWVCIYFSVLYSMKRPSSSSPPKYLNTYMRECVYLQKNEEKNVFTFYLWEKWCIIVSRSKVFLYKCFVVCYNCVFLWKYIHGGGGIVWLCCCSIKNFQKPWKNMRYFIIENLNTWIDCLHTWWKSTIWMEWHNFAWSFWVIFVIFTFV